MVIKIAYNAWLTALEFIMIVMCAKLNAYQNTMLPRYVVIVCVVSEESATTD